MAIKCYTLLQKNCLHFKRRNDETRKRGGRGLAGSLDAQHGPKIVLREYSSDFNEDATNTLLLVTLLLQS